MDAQHAVTLVPDQKRKAGLCTPSLERARSGDVEAFRHLMRAYQARVFSIAYRFTGSRPDAEEILQDVFVQLHGALNQICESTQRIRGSTAKRGSMQPRSWKRTTA
jgi:DNA-directed RNA polymerase specialized sigma24 family protein